MLHIFHTRMQKDNSNTAGLCIAGYIISVKIFLCQNIGLLYLLFDKGIVESTLLCTKFRISL